MISVVIPIYNAEKYLDRSIGSVMKQTYTDLEIICVNDGSTDKTPEILQEFQKRDKRIKIINKSNAGVSAARNDGIKASTGDYICFLDADDEIEITAIESLYNKLIEKKVDVVRGNYLLHNSERKNTHIQSIDNIKFDKKQIREIVIPQIIDGTISCFVGLLLIKKEKIDLNKLFDEKIAIMEDKIFYINLLLNVENIYTSSIITYNYHMNDNSKERFRKYNKKNLEQSIEVYNKVKQILVSEKIYSDGVKRDLATTHLKIVMIYLMALYKEEVKNEAVEKEIQRVYKFKEIEEMLENAKLEKLSEDIQNFIIKRKI